MLDCSPFSEGCTSRSAVEMGGSFVPLPVSSVSGKGLMGDLDGINSPEAVSNEGRLSSGILDAALYHPPGKNLEDPDPEDSRRLRPADISGIMSGDAPLVIELRERPSCL